MRKKSKRKNKWIWIITIPILLFIISIINNSPKWVSGPRVGLVEIHAPIYSSTEYVRDLNYFSHNDDIDAIVIHLETPGGSVAASQEIYQKVKTLSKKGKRIFVSMGNVAASGGYYIALGADTIIANPGTATGSIGVIMGYPVLNELMEKAGINYTTIKSGKYKDSGSSFRESTFEDNKYFQNLVDNLYEQFINVVVQERSLVYDDVKSIANGMVYSGEQALDLGLIDLLGTLEDAILIAGESTGSLETPLIIRPPDSKKNIWEVVFGEIHSNAPLNWIYPKPEYRLMY